MTEQTSLDLGLSSMAVSPPAPAAPPAAPRSQTASPAPQPAAQQPQDRTRGHSPALDQRQAAAASPADATIEIDGVPHRLDSLRETLQRDAAEQSRRLTLPPSPEGYEAKLPENFHAPEGMTFEFRGDDPLLANAKAMAHAKGWSQQDFSDALGIFAATQVEHAATLHAAKQAEIAKLGAAGPARVTAVCNWLKAVGGPDAAVLARTLDYAPVAGTVQAFERMMQKFSSQGGAGFSQQHRSQPDAGKIPGYESLSFEQKRCAQDRLNGRR
jgi:hypothetical protein